MTIEKKKQKTRYFTTKLYAGKYFGNEIIRQEKNQNGKYIKYETNTRKEKGARKKKSRRLSHERKKKVDEMRAIKRTVKKKKSQMT